MPTPPTCRASRSSANPRRGGSGPVRIRLAGGCRWRPSPRASPAGRGGRSWVWSATCVTAGSRKCSSTSTIRRSRSAGRRTTSWCVHRPIRSRLRPRCVRQPGSSIRRRSSTRSRPWTPSSVVRRPRGGSPCGCSCCSRRWRSVSRRSACSASSRSTSRTVAASLRSAWRSASRAPASSAVCWCGPAGGCWPAWRSASPPRSSRAAPSAAFSSGSLRTMA